MKFIQWYIVKKKGCAAMSANAEHFRTVAFGGFHKQDVLNYITNAAREKQAESSALKKQAEDVLEEKAQLEEQYNIADAAWKESAAECERLSALLTQRTAALEKAERELAELKSEHTRCAARLAEVEEKLPALEADSAAYSELKDHTATIEMEAHCKAQEIVDQAQSQAVRIRGELEGWLRRVQSGYQRLRTDVGATVTHLTGELERGCKTLGETVSAFAQHDAALIQLLESEKRENGPQAPDPLPLEEREEEDV